MKRVRVFNPKEKDLLISNVKEILIDCKKRGIVLEEDIDKCVSTILSIIREVICRRNLLDAPDTFNRQNLISKVCSELEIAGLVCLRDSSINYRQYVKTRLRFLVEIFVLYENKLFDSYELNTLETEINNIFDQVVLNGGSVSVNREIFVYSLMTKACRIISEYKKLGYDKEFSVSDILKLLDEEIKKMYELDFSDNRFEIDENTIARIILRIEISFLNLSNIFSLEEVRYFEIGLFEILMFFSNGGTKFQDNILDFVYSIIITCFKEIIKYMDYGFDCDIPPEEIFHEVFEELIRICRFNLKSSTANYKAFVKTSIKTKIATSILEKKYSGFIVNFGIHKRNAIVRIIDECHDFFSQNGSWPSLDEIAFKLNKDKNEILCLMRKFNEFQRTRGYDEFGEHSIVEENSSNNSYDNILLKIKEFLYSQKRREDASDFFMTLLESVDLTDEEIKVFVLRFKITCLGVNELQYKGKTIVIGDRTLDFEDDSSLTYEEIALYLGCSYELVRRLLNNALYKIRMSEVLISSDFIDYVSNPDLIFRMRDIALSINDSPFTCKYPNFNAYFQEYSLDNDGNFIVVGGYSDEEIKCILDELKPGQKSFVDYIKKFETDIYRFECDSTMKKMMLCNLIYEVYEKLIEKYGIRSMKESFWGVDLFGDLELIPSTEKNNLNGICAFFPNVSFGTITFILEGITTFESNLLHFVFGDNLLGNDYQNNFTKLTPANLNYFKMLITRLQNKIKNILCNFRCPKIFLDFAKEFLCYGYTLEDVINILNEDLGIELMKEFYSDGISEQRKAEIIDLVLEMLMQTPGVLSGDEAKNYKPYARVRSHYETCLPQYIDMNF